MLVLTTIVIEHKVAKAYSDTIVQCSAYCKKKIFLVLASLNDMNVIRACTR